MTTLRLSEIIEDLIIVLDQKGDLFVEYFALDIAKKEPEDTRFEIMIATPLIDLKALGGQGA